MSDAPKKEAPIQTKRLLGGAVVFMLGVLLVRRRLARPSSPSWRRRGSHVFAPVRERGLEQLREPGRGRGGPCAARALARQKVCERTHPVMQRNFDYDGLVPRARRS